MLNLLSFARLSVYWLSSCKVFFNLFATAIPGGTLNKEVHYRNSLPVYMRVTTWTPFQHLLITCREFLIERGAKSDSIFGSSLSNCRLLAKRISDFIFQLIYNSRQTGFWFWFWNVEVVEENELRIQKGKLTSFNSSI